MSYTKLAYNSLLVFPVVMGGLIGLFTLLPLLRERAGGPIDYAIAESIAVAVLLFGVVRLPPAVVSAMASLRTSPTYPKATGNCLRFALYVFIAFFLLPWVATIATHSSSWVLSNWRDGVDLRMVPMLIWLGGLPIVTADLPRSVADRLASQGTSFAFLDALARWPRFLGVLTSCGLAAAVYGVAAIGDPILLLIPLALVPFLLFAGFVIVMKSAAFSRIGRPYKGMAAFAFMSLLLPFSFVGGGFAFAALLLGEDWVVAVFLGGAFVGTAVIAKARRPYQYIAVGVIAVWVVIVVSGWLQFWALGNGLDKLDGEVRMKAERLLRDQRETAICYVIPGTPRLADPVRRRAVSDGDGSLRVEHYTWWGLPDDSQCKEFRYEIADWRPS